MSAVEVDARDVFADPGLHDGQCCECCEDHCPQWERATPAGEYPQVWQPTGTITVHGDEYLCDRFMLIRRTVLTHLPTPEDNPPSDIAFTEAMIQQITAKLPSPPRNVPTEIDPEQGLGVLGRIVRAGLIQRDAGSDKIVLLYVGNVHVGWATKAVSGMQRAEYIRIRTVADRANVDFYSAKYVLAAIEELG